MDWLSSGPFGLLSLAFCQLTGFGRFFGHPSIFGFCCFFAMVLECVKTCVIHASELVASYEKARVIELLRECLDFEELSAIQFCPRGLIRVTFKDVADKEDFVRVGSLTLDGHDLSVTSSDKPYSFVYVHYFPVEGDDALIRDELGKYGEVINIKHQSFSGIPGLLTGSRVLTMVLSDPVPAEFRIDDFPVRVWYKGIPPFCQICKISGHKAADCQFNGKCRRCGSPDHKAHACTRPWGQPAVPMEVAVPVVVPDPSETVVPAVGEVSVEDADSVSAPTGVPVPSPSGCVLGTAPSAPVAEEVQASSVPVPVVPVTASGPSVVSAVSPEVASASSCVASSRFFTPDLRREFFSEYREMLCKWAEDAAYVCSNGGGKVVKVVPVDTPDEVRITSESGGTRVVHVNQVRVTRVDNSGKSEEELAQFILKVKDDPSYRISFKGSIVDKVSPCYDSSFLDVVFSDHIKSESRRLPAKSLWVKKIALSNSSSANASNCVNNVLAGDGVVMVSRSGSRSVVPTAAVLAAELIKRTTPPSVVGVPKCRKKL